MKNLPLAGLEPAALCLASSIRLSLTARICPRLLAGLYLGHRSPDPYSLWGSHQRISHLTVSCGLPNPHGFLLEKSRVPEALRASPHMGSST